MELLSDQYQMTGAIAFATPPESQDLAANGTTLKNKVSTKQDGF
jgi:hypothetical protein